MKISVQSKSFHWNVQLTAGKCSTQWPAPANYSCCCCASACWPVRRRRRESLKSVGDSVRSQWSEARESWQLTECDGFFSRCHLPCQRPAINYFISLGRPPGERPLPPLWAAAHRPECDWMGQFRDGENWYVARIRLSDTVPTHPPPPPQAPRTTT